MGFLSGLFGKPKQAKTPAIAAPTTTDVVGKTTNLNLSSPAGALDGTDTTQNGRGSLLGG